MRHNTLKDNRKGWVVHWQDDKGNNKKRVFVGKFAYHQAALFALEVSTEWPKVTPR